MGHARVTAESKPAFYALEGGGWRDYVTLLHPPYTLWHLSYVVIGAALAPQWLPGRLLATLAAFFLAVGIGAHALDELNGRPLRTSIPAWVLVALATASIAGAVAIGLVGAVRYDLWLLVFIAFGVFIVVAYNLELGGSRFHNDAWFAIAWGGFPLLTAYFAAAQEIRAAAVIAAVFASFSSYAQRLLSTQVRLVRRRVTSVSGTVDYRDGRSEPVTAQMLMRAPEEALRALAVATIALAVALVVLRTA
jgi:hypothetical protein